MTHRLLTSVLIPFILIIGFAPFFVSGQAITAPQIDALVQRTLTTFDVPGIAIAVVKDGKVIHAKGYGVRSLKTRQKVDENTLFGIAAEQKKNTTPIDFTNYAGTYRDRWFGDVVLSQQGGKGAPTRWEFRSVRSPKLTGELFYYKGNTFVVK